MKKLLNYSWRVPTLVAIIFLIIVNLGVHTPLLITDYFGEADAARIANDAIKASYSDGFNELEYTVHSSPLYSETLRLLLKYRVIDVSNITLSENR